MLLRFLLSLAGVLYPLRNNFLLGLERLTFYSTAPLKQTLGLARSLVTYWRPGRQKPLQALYRRFVGPGDLVFDIGAHMGDRTAAFAALGARVVAAEPNPHVMRWLRKLVAGHGDIVFLPLAVGSRPGRADLALSYRTPTVSSLASRWRETLKQEAPGFRNVRWERTLSVPVTTLDELIVRYGKPAFCKIDVEGFEAEVLAGLSCPIQALSFEFVAGTLDQALLCLAELERLGNYEFNAISGENRTFIHPCWQSHNQIRGWIVDGADGIPSGDIYARANIAK